MPAPSPLQSAGLGKRSLTNRSLHFRALKFLLLSLNADCWFSCYFIVILVLPKILIMFFADFFNDFFFVILLLLFFQLCFSMGTFPCKLPWLLLDILCVTKRNIHSKEVSSEIETLKMFVTYFISKYIICPPFPFPSYSLGSSRNIYGFRNIWINSLAFLLCPSFFSCHKTYWCSLRSFTLWLTTALDAHLKSN